MTAAQLRVTYQLDRTAVSSAEADWLERLPEAPRGEQDAAVRRLRSSAASAVDRDQLHVIGMGLAVLGLPEEAVGVFVRASELDPGIAIDALNAAVALAHTGDLERARLWLTPVAQGDGELSGVARQFIAEIDRVQQVQPPASGTDLRRGTTDIAALLQAVNDGGPNADAALNSLRRLVHHEPANEHYRHSLMFALVASADLTGAVTQAEVLANRRDPPTHERHFNVAQAFWFGNERERAQRHFELAYQLAETDQERQDVVSMLEHLREQDNEVDED